MKKALLTLLLLALVVPLVGAGCGDYVVRDEVVYKTELNFMEQTAFQPADKLVEWINLSCKCAEGKFIEPNAALCKASAKLVVVVKARVPYHKAMMLYNASITEKRPPKDPPAVPETSTLCPGGN